MIETKYKIIILIFFTMLLIYIINNIWNSFEITNQKKVNEIYQLLKHIDCTFKKTNTKYIIIGGTLLGCVRHNGLIPWDKDADIAVLNKSFKEILQILKSLEKYNIISYMNMYNGIVKVKFNNSNTIIDIFILQKDKNNIYRFTSPYDTIYSNEYFNENELFPLKKYKFGPLDLYGPNVAINYLDRTYFNWNTTAETWKSDMDKSLNITRKSTNININLPAIPNIIIEKECKKINF
jgi:phosphorylcholine metabolism protein LicD